MRDMYASNPIASVEVVEEEDSVERVEVPVAWDKTNGPEMVVVFVVVAIALAMVSPTGDDPVP